MKILTRLTIIILVTTVAIGLGVGFGVKNPQLFRGFLVKNQNN